MSQLDIIIPIYNKAGSITGLLDSIDKNLSGADIDYNVIFIDDHSTDSTAKEIKEAAGNYTNGKRVLFDSNNIGNRTSKSSRVKLFDKEGKKGKARSILEGFKHAEAEYVLILDSDFENSTEFIPQLFKMAKDKGVALAQNKNSKGNLLLNFISKINTSVSAKLLLGLDCDVYSGIKMLKREIGLRLSNSKVTNDNLGLLLLLKAKDMGYEVGTLDVDSLKWEREDSIINIISESIELFFSAIKLKYRKNPIYQNVSTLGGSYIGSGITRNGKHYQTHTNLPESESAIETFYFWQKILILESVLVFITFLLISPKLVLVSFVTILTFIYFADMVFSLRLLLKSLNFPPEVKFTDKEFKSIDEKDLPVYSILCPLYKEQEILPHFVDAIKRIDWPKNKLDVQLLLEEDDVETQKAAQDLDLPDYFRIIIVPDSQPKTKPKACNYGFGLTKGEYLVIYDAEDRPDPLQLKKAYLAFKKLSSKVICLQSKLNYYNTNQNILTRLFTAEYSLWFDLILPGLQSIEATIPLGGTSNHFKTKALKYLDGWDSFNVTEDCDLGVRLFKEGFKTAIIDSTTYEEANSKLKSWLKQRSRWIKGYWQTYLVHTRDLLGFFKRHGYQALVFQLTIGLRMTFILINPVLWTVTVLYFLLNGQFADTIESLYPTPIFYLATTTLILGNFIHFYNYMIGLAKRHQWQVMKYTFLVPIYWLMTSFAAGIALYQLIFKPYHWEKTKHGLHLNINPKKNPVKINFIFNKVSLDLSFLTDAFRETKLLFRTIINNIADLLSLLQDYSCEPVENGRNILIFNWRDTKHVWGGGAEVYLHEIAKRWVKNGNQVTQFCGWDGINKREETVDGVRVIRRGGFYTVYLFAVLYYLFKFRNKYDVIIDSANGIPFFSPFFSNISVVLLIHHVHQNVFRENLTFPLSEIARFMESHVLPFCYRNNKIITISESSKNDITAKGLMQDGDISIVNPGINHYGISQFKKTEYPSFTYVGRLKAYKNIDIAIKAFSEIVKIYKNAMFYIAGKGDDEKRLRKLVHKLGLSENIQLLGFVSEERKTELLSRCWISIQPSSFEGWGITVIEANACGTPVIAADVNGLSDSVVDGKTGLLFQDRDIKDLEVKMKYLIENTQALSMLSKQSLEWSKGFSWTKSSERFLYEIEKAIEEQSDIYTNDIVIEHSFAYNEKGEN